MDTHEIVDDGNGGLLEVEKPILLTVGQLKGLGIEDQSNLHEILKRAVQAGDDQEVIERIMADFLKATQALTDASKALAENQRMAGDEAAFEALSRDAILTKVFDDANDEERAELFKKAAETFGLKAANSVLGVDNFTKALIRPITEKNPQYDQIMEIREAHDLAMIYLAAHGAVKEKMGGKADQFEVNQKMYREVLERLGNEGLEVKGIADAMDTLTATEGQEWVPQILSSNMVNDIYLELRVASLFRRYTMSAPTFSLPIRTRRTRAYRMTQATAVNQYFTSLAKAHSMETDKVTMNAEKLGFAQFVSDELGQDAVLPVLQMMRQEAVWGMASTIDDATINGSTLLNDIDNTGTDGNRLWNNTTPVSDEQLDTGASDARNAWDGLRKYTNSSARTDFGNALPTLNGIRDLRKPMGKYAATPNSLALLVSTYTHIDLLKFNEVVTLEKFGPQATIKVGEIGRIDNIPIIISDYIYTNLNASGRFDNVTKNRTIITCVNTEGFAFGDRQQTVVEGGRQPLAGQNFILTTWRGDFIKLFPTAENLVAEGYNVKY